MTIRNPFDLPEIRLVLASSLTTDDLTRCVRVCKDWHASFLPYLWRKVDIHQKTSKQPTLALLQQHRHHVRHLTYQEKAPDDHRSLHFPALTTLHFVVRNHNTEMVGNQTSLVHLKLIGSLPYKIDWIPSVGLPNLKSLTLTGITVLSQDEDTVWNLFSRLEVLRMYNSTISGHSQLMKRDWRIKDLTLSRVGGMPPMDQLRWIEHCTHLKRLSWRFRLAQGDAVLMEFLQSITANTWPELEELHNQNFLATDQQASFIISKMQRVLGLSIKYSQPFKTALRTHFSWIKILNITNAPGNNTAFIIEILKSCPQLEIFEADEVQDCDAVVDDTPWACECSLSDLKVQFRPKREEQRGLFKRLSKLRNLERLDVSNWINRLTFAWSPGWIN
ncbi:MAG: hypothetical protein J3Q66DRAFT_352659 [Benniella sp.]|nr:MAG: hypothetical protein J3Q66DRAFT_352659 [Benniella sp.]